MASPLFDNVLVHDSSQATYWSSQTLAPDTSVTSLSANLVCGSVLEVRWARTIPTGLREDLAVYTFHLSVNAGPGAPMSKLDSADAARVEAAWQTAFAGNYHTYIANDWSVKEFAWRHFGADFPLDKNGWSKPGPYWRINPGSHAGSDTSARLPDQVALNCTFRTASRKHWGRFYTGGITTGSLADSQLGHASNTLTDALAGSTYAFLNDINNDARSTNVWVWSAKYRGALSVNEISVDNTFDVIRRRRAKMPSYRKTYTS